MTAQAGFNGIVTYDLEEVSASQRRVCHQILEAHLFYAECRLETVWCGTSVDKDAKALRDAILENVRDHGKLGKV